MPKQDVALELYYGGGWHDLVDDDDVYTGSPIKITRGQGDESPALRPAQISAQLANDDDMYRISNPVSPLYGRVGRNTPTRVKVGGAVRGVAEAATWEADQTRDFRRTPRRGSAWVDLSAGGLLQRVGQWTEPLRSTFTEYNAGLSNCVGCWPMEDPTGARSLFTPTPGAVSTSYQGATPQSQSRFAGSGPLTDMAVDTRSKVGGKFAPVSGSATGGWQFSWCARFGTLGGTGDFFVPAQWKTADGSPYSIAITNGTDLTLLADDPSSGTRINTTFADALTDTDWSKWNCFIVRATYSAGTTTISFYWMTEDSPVFAGPYTGTFSGNTSSLSGGSWNISLGFSPVSECTVGHVVGTDGTANSFVGIARVRAMKGYAGETTADRLDRLCTLKGLNYSIIGDQDLAAVMGPQQIDTFPNQLKEIISTEDALLFDAIDNIELVLLLRNARYNQTPALTLTPTDLPSLPKETTAAADVHNVVTASQRNGGDYTVQDDTGPLGTLPPPDGAGEAKQTVDVNVADEDADLPQQANWWLRRGTVDLPRFPQVTINLAAAGPALIAAVEALDIGSVIEIAGMREYTVRLIVLGWTETVGTHSRVIVLTCVPDQQFQVGRWDSASSLWTARTTLENDLTSTDTWVGLTTADSRESWSTKGNQYLITMGGETMTVLGMSGPNSVALADGTFEAGIGFGWNASGCTAADSTAQAHRGTHSALLTITGSPTEATLRANLTHTAAPSQTFTVSCWAYVATGRNISVHIDWYNGATFLSRVGTTVAVPSATWTLITASGTAPASTTRLEYGPSVGSSPATGTQIWVDDVDCVRTDTYTGRQLALVTRSANGIVKAQAAGAVVDVATAGRWAL